MPPYCGPAEGLTFIHLSVLTLKEMTRTALDVEILESLVAGPRPVATLIGKHPRATVYRHVAKLRAEALIAPSRPGYPLTSVVQRLLADHESRVFSDGLRRVYPPLGEVPTPQHVALLELIFAAVASASIRNRMIATPAS